MQSRTNLQDLQVCFEILCGLGAEMNLFRKASTRAQHGSPFTSGRGKHEEALQIVPNCFPGDLFP